MYKRIFLMVLDSVGIGYCPDQDEYNDANSNTIRSCSTSKEYNIQTMRKLGIFNIDNIGFETPYEKPIGCYGKCIEKSIGKDTITGHFEMMGIIKYSPFPTYPNGFPQYIIDEFEKETKCKVIVNKPYSGTEVIKDYGEEHIKTGNLIVYTSGDSVFQIAAHKKIVPIEKLYEYCIIARNILKGKDGVGRVIARPFDGEYPFIRTEERKDFSMQAPINCLNYLLENNYDTISVGRIKDLFKGQKIEIESNNNKTTMETCDRLLKEDFNGLAFINFEDFDMLYGHRNNIDGYAKALSEFDNWLDSFINNMKDDDLLIITADHGNDPATLSTDHSREAVPLLVYNKLLKSTNLGIRNTYADIGKTILDNFNIKNDLPGISIFKDIKNTNHNNIRMYDVIAKKRDKLPLSKEEIDFFINGYVNKEIPDYQVSSLLMAIYLNGMNDEEISNLTDSMIKSGDVIDLSVINGNTVDKHSTGGVGDKTTLIIAPVVASLGGYIAKMSGRGLGHTGGTIDKLESIPNFKVSLSHEEFIKQVNDINVALISQSGNLTPADKLLYALRDTTATVESIPLIASSIMSKKIASGCRNIVLDVKTGKGALMKTIEDSKKLAEEMIRIGKSLNRNVIAILTNMDSPLGNNVGNSLEVIEAIEVLKGRGPYDLRELSIELATLMLQLVTNEEYELCKNKVIENINNGKALDKFRELIKAQGGNDNVIDDYNLFPTTSHIYEIKSPFSGYINEFNAETIGITAGKLGCARLVKEDNIDYGAGIILNKKINDYVNVNDTIAYFYTNKEDIQEIANDFIKAIKLGNEKVTEPKLIYEIIR